MSDSCTSQSPEDPQHESKGQRYHAIDFSDAANTDNLSSWLAANTANSSQSDLYPSPVEERTTYGAFDQHRSSFSRDFAQFVSLEADYPHARHIIPQIGPGTAPVTRSPTRQAIPIAKQQQRNPWRRARKQNRSCDQCRASKRACNLEPTDVLDGKALRPCAVCITRGRPCTINWLESRSLQCNTQSGKKKRTSKSFRLSSRQVRKAEWDATTKARTDSPVELTSRGSKEKAPLIIGGDHRLVHDVLLSSVVSGKFRIFLSTFELPLSYWLSQGCIPFPTGLESLPKCKGYIDWLASDVLSACPGTNAIDLDAILAPRILVALSFLDSFVDRQSISLPKVSPSNRSRAIDNALKWTIVASGAQFCDPAEHGLGDKEKAKYLETKQDLARASWLQARNAIFGCISSQSFRLAFALFIFGIITPPLGVAEMGGGYEGVSPHEDSMFSVREGLFRLRALSLKTAALSKAAASLSPSSTQQVALRSLLNTVDWLAVMSQGVIGAVYNTISEPCSIDVGDSIFDSSHLNFSFDDSTTYRGSHKVPAGCENTDVDSDLWNNILMRSMTARSLAGALVASLKAGTASQELFLLLMRWATSLKVLLWKAAVDLQNMAQLLIKAQTRPSLRNTAVSLERAFGIVMDLISLWKSSFGKLEEEAVNHIRQLSALSQSMLAFMINHANLGVLHLMECTEQIEAEVQKHRASPACSPKDSDSDDCPLDHLNHVLSASAEKRRRLQVESAKLIAIISSRTMPSSVRRSLSAQKAESGTPAAKGLVDDLPLGLWCHPFPPMIIQAKYKAALCLLDVAFTCRSKGQEDYQIISLLDDTLDCLRNLQSSLVSFPHYVITGPDLATLDLLRASLG